MATYSGADKRLKYLFGISNQCGTATPTGTAEEGAIYIQYDSTDYSVVALWSYLNGTWQEVQVGGGGGGSSGGVTLTETEIFNGALTTNRQTGTLSESYKNFDLLLIMTSANANFSSDKGSYLLPVSQIPESVSNQQFGLAYRLNNNYWYSVRFSFPTETSIMLFDKYQSNFEAYINKIIGMKWESPDTLHHYSTTEQVIGTWIDGSTLYEKTYYLANASNTTYILEQTFQASIKNSTGAWTDSGGYRRPIPYEYTNSDAFVYSYDNQLKLQFAPRNATDVCITVQYTKTAS